MQEENQPANEAGDATPELAAETVIEVTVPSDPYFALGMDVDRLWVSSFMFNQGANISILTGREVNIARGGDGELKTLEKNIVSIAMENHVAVSLRDLLLRQYPLEAAD